MSGVTANKSIRQSLEKLGKIEDCEFSFLKYCTIMAQWERLQELRDLKEINLINWISNHVQDGLLIRMLYSWKVKGQLKDNVKYKVGVIGAGAWGTALSNIITKKEKVILWAKEKSVCENINKLSENKRYLPKIKLSKRIKCTTSITDVVDCEILFLVSPVQYLTANLLKLKK